MLLLDWKNNREIKKKNDEEEEEEQDSEEQDDEKLSEKMKRKNVFKRIWKNWLSLKC